MAHWKAKIYEKLILFAFISFCLPSASGKISVIPENTEAASGTTVTLHCKSSTSSIEWQHLAVGQSFHEPVYQDGFIFNDYKERFSINRTDDGKYNLVIRNVSATDAGKFTCMEKSDEADQKTAELIVFEQYPSDKSCAAKFTCSPVCDALELTCGMKAHGNIIPAMEWQESVSGIVPSNSNSYNGIIMSSIQLQPRNATTKTYTCRVKYSSDSSLASQFSWLFFVKEPLVMLVSEEKAQSKTIIIIVFMVIMAITLVALIIVILILFRKNKRKKSKLVNIEEQRPELTKESSLSKDVESRSISESSSLLKSADCKDAEGSPVSGNSQLFLPADGNDNSKGLVPCTPLNKGNSIHGIGILGDEVFLVTRDGCVVEVFDLESAEFKRAWKVEGLLNPNDMAVCHRRNLIFICDWKKAAENREIFCCDKNGKLTYRWISEDEKGRISVTKETNVIVAESWYNTIREYTYFGRLIHKFNTGRQKLHLWHALKLENGNFVASFGDMHDDIREICTIDNNGTTLYSTSQISNIPFKIPISVPRSLAVDAEGCIYVGDLYNGRILLLTPELKCKGTFEVSENNDRLRGPLRICLHEYSNKHQLFVADNAKKADRWSDGRILVWDVATCSDTAIAL